MVKAARALACYAGPNGGPIALSNGSTAKETQDDFLSEAGTVPLALDGTLTLTLTGGFVPDFSDIFTILTSNASLAGAFNHIASGMRLTTTDGMSNPVVDRLRVVSNAEQNLRIDPVTGFVFTDGVLAYATGDVNELANPNVATIAYTPNSGGVTTLFGIDDTTFRVVTINPPSAGTLISGPAFGAAAATHCGFDVGPDGTVFIAGRHDVAGQPTEWVLATLDVVAGTGVSHGQIGDGTIPIRDIAIATAIEFSAEHYAVAESAGSATITVRRSGNLSQAATVQYTTFSGTASAGSDYVTASGTLSFASEMSRRRSK